MENLTLSSLDKPPEIYLHGYHSFIRIPPFSFLFSIFPITALAGLQHLSFFIGLLTLQTALQHSWARIMPPPHLCVHTTPCPWKSLIPFIKTSLELLHPCVASFLFCISPQAPEIAALAPALVLFFYLFCVNTAHTYKCAHGQPHSVFIRVRIEACWWFKHCKHVLNGCLPHSVGDVIPCAAWAKFNILHMQAAKRVVEHRKTYDQKKAIQHWLWHR